MRKILKLLYIVAIVFYAQVSFAQEPPIRDGLIGYWPLDGNTNDISGNNHNGVLNGPSLTTDRNGNTNSAYYFDGVNDYIELPATIIDNLEEGTVTMWVKIETTTTHQMPFARNGVDVPNWMGIAIVAPNSTSSIKSYFMATSGRADSYDTYAAYNDSWHFITCMWSSTEVSYWVDGNKVGVIAVSGANTSTGTGLWLGNAVSNRSYWTKGKIDEVAIYSKALTETEIQNLYNGTTNSGETSCLWSKSENTKDIYYENGNVRIGTESTTYNSSNYKLAVQGTILSTELKVVDISGWADYVFDPDYYLKPLEEVEKYIKEHRHLEHVPSEKEVNENGLSIVENNTVLLRKIEELTLYVIQQNKKIKELEETKVEFEAKVESLETENKKLKEMQEAIKDIQKQLEGLNN